MIDQFQASIRPERVHMDSAINRKHKTTEVYKTSSRAMSSKPNLKFRKGSNGETVTFVTIATGFVVCKRGMVPCAIPYVGECLLERTLILSRRRREIWWPVHFLTTFNFPSVAARCPFAAEWKVSEHPSYDRRVRLEPSVFPSAVKCSNHWATSPCCM